MSSLDKSSFVLGNELWEEHFESLLAYIYIYIIDIYGRKENLGYMAMLNAVNNPILTLQLGILGKLLGSMGRIVKGCVREVSLAHVSCILMYVYVAPPTPVGAWSMALGLRQRFYCLRSTSTEVPLHVPLLLFTFLTHTVGKHK